MKSIGIAKVTTFSAALCLATMSHAKDWSIVPSLGFKYRNLSFDQELLVNGGRANKGGLDVNLPTASVGLTFIFRKFYASMKYDQSFESNTDSSVPVTDISFFNGQIPTGFNDTDVQTAVTRTDFTFTVGYTVWRNLNVFLGYLDGETEITPDPVYFNFFDSEGSFVGEAFNWAQVVQDNFPSAPNYRQNYKESGGFLGVSYGWTIGRDGVLSLSGALAFMDGTYEDNSPANTDFRFEGDSQGYSLALNWSAPLTKRVGYYLDLRYQAYDFDGDDKSGNFPGLEVETEEALIGLTGGISWYF